MEIGDLKNGFMIINGGKPELLPEDLFYIPSKEREEEIIKSMSEDIRQLIEDETKKQTK